MTKALNVAVRSHGKQMALPIRPTGEEFSQGVGGKVQERMLVSSGLLSSSAQRWGRLPDQKQSPVLQKDRWGEEQGRDPGWDAACPGTQPAHGDPVEGNQENKYLGSPPSLSSPAIPPVPTPSTHRSPRPTGSRRLGSPLVSPHGCGVPIGQPPGMCRRVGGSGGGQSCGIRHTGLKSYSASGWELWANQPWHQTCE